MNQLAREFSKKELYGIARELDLDVELSTRKSKMLEMIVEDIDENGVPDTTTESECSDDMFRFLVAAGYCDEDGELLDDEESDDESDDDLGSDEGEEDVEQKFPQCFGFYDDRDPPCKKCGVAVLCETRRLGSRPPCFGRLFDENDEECDGCLEKLDCKNSL